MPYHLSYVKKIALVLFLGGCFLWTKRDRFSHWLCNDSVANTGLVEFGPLPMIPDVPLVPDLPEAEELNLPQQHELMEQQIELREKLMKELQEKTDRIKID
jgi:ABC-type Fe3+ transport system substrate-binding protein